MKLGLFLMPVHPPERAPYDAAQWDLQVIKWADQYGFSEAWLGEHYTVGWEPLPSPDLLIAQALRETKQIVLAPGAHLLPYHHPSELALRVAYLDHLAQGRYMLGIGAGAFQSDAKLFGTNGQNHEMMQESLDIMIKIWTASGPFHHNGKFWSVEYPEYDALFAGPHLKPFQKPHPPIGMAGLSPRSSTLRLAGQRGFLPMSFNLNPEYLAGHWEAYAEGASERGVTPSRRDWRVGREFFVADTDDAALDYVLNSGMGRAQNEYLLPTFAKFGMTKLLAPDPSVPESMITTEYLARNVWLVGSPETVARKLREHYHRAGGWGTLIGFAFDCSDDPEPWRRSMELMATEVMTRVRDLEIPG